MNSTTSIAGAGVAEARGETARHILDLEAETARLAARLATDFGGEQP